MIEAMACGTPVIAFPRGSVSEVIDDGVTGFIVDTESDAVNAIKRLSELDRYQVRATFERRFSARRMAKEYVGHYHQVAGVPREELIRASRKSLPMGEKPNLNP